MHAWQIRQPVTRVAPGPRRRSQEQSEAESLALDLAALAEAGLIELAARADGEWVAARPDDDSTSDRRPRIGHG